MDLSISVYLSMYLYIYMMYLSQSMILSTPFGKVSAVSKMQEAPRQMTPEAATVG